MAGFLDYRNSGYCTKQCSIGEPPGIASKESMAWKDKISVPSLRSRPSKLQDTYCVTGNVAGDLVLTLDICFSPR